MVHIIYRTLLFKFMQPPQAFLFFTSTLNVINSGIKIELRNSLRNQRIHLMMAFTVKIKTVIDQSQDPPIYCPIEYNFQHIQYSNCRRVAWVQKVWQQHLHHLRAINLSIHMNIVPILQNLPVDLCPLSLNQHHKTRRELEYQMCSRKQKLIQPIHFTQRITILRVKTWGVPRWIEHSQKQILIWQSSS